MIPPLLYVGVEMKTISVLLVESKDTLKVTNSGIAIVSYKDIHGNLVQGIGIEFSDEFPELPLVTVQNPTGQI